MPYEITDHDLQLAADSLAKASIHEPTGPGPLWHHQGWQLPAYIQHIANDLIQSGKSQSHAIAIAVASVKRWAAGTGKVDSGTRAAARKALAEWEALKAKAHATLSDEDLEFCEQLSVGFEIDENTMAEMFLDDDDLSEDSLRLSEGLVWKTILREGKWRYSPNDRPGKSPIGITIREDGESDPKKMVVSMSELLKNFKEGAIEHVTVPTSHANKVFENTGYIRDARISKDEQGRAVLEAGMEFTEPDIEKKVLNRSIANTSAGIVFDYLHKENGTKYNAVLEHAALTNRPWLNGMKPFGVAASQEGGMTVMSFSEEHDAAAGSEADVEGLDLAVLTNIGSLQEVAGALINYLKAEQDPEDKAEAASLLKRVHSLIAKDRAERASGGPIPSMYSVEENEALEDELLLSMMDIPEEVELADGSKKPYGNVSYADPGYQEDGKERYPVDNEEHVRAAWAYISKAKNAAAYTAGQLKKVKARIRSAMARSGIEVAMSDEQLTIENAATLVALADRKEDTVAEEKTTTEAPKEETKVLGFSEEEVREALAERDRLKAENTGLKLAEREQGVKDQIKSWEGDKFSPAILKVAEEVLLAEVTPEGVTLSSDGKEEKLTVSEVVTKLVEASPKIELEDKKVSEEAATEGTKPQVEAEEVELADEVKDRANFLFLYEGKSGKDALEQAQAEYDSKNS